MCQRLHHRVSEDLSRRRFLGGMAAMLAPFALPGTAAAASDDRPLLLTNLRLFDGTGKPVRHGVQVLVQGQRIADLLPAAATVEGAQVLDCQGKLVMPGLIDVHWHTMLAGVSQMVAMTADLGYLYLVAAQEAQRTLLRGFTSVRDAGGPAFALQRAIDEGLVAGPRIFPSGAMISQTSGHGDFRLRSDLPRADGAPMSLVENTGVAMIADGEAQVLRRVREQLMLGATQIKMLAGGGVASQYDPLDSTQFTERELRAGVEAASDWNTYVMAHVYASKGIQRAIRAGVKCIEHGQLADEATVRMMRDEACGGACSPFAGRGQQPLSRPCPPCQPEAGGRRHGQRLCHGAEVRCAYRLGDGHSVQPQEHGWPGPASGQADAFLRSADPAGPGHGDQWRTAGAVG
jgi:imidazolonepropionase-like amidohydrolase